MEQMNAEYKKELRTELGNAIAAYAQVLRRASEGILTPGFAPLLKCSELELRYKLEILKELYNSF